MKNTKLILVIIYIVFGIQLGQSQELIVYEGFENNCSNYLNSFSLGCFENWISVSGSADTGIQNETNYEGFRHAHLYASNTTNCFLGSDLGEGIAYTYNFKKGCTYSLSFGVARSDIGIAEWILTDGLENNTLNGICIAENLVPPIPTTAQVLDGAVPTVYEDSEWMPVQNFTFTPEKDYSHLWFRISNINLAKNTFGACYIDSVVIKTVAPIVDMEIPEVICNGDPIQVIDNSSHYTQYKFNICRVGPDDQCLSPGGNYVSSGWINGQIENLDLAQAYTTWSGENEWEMECEGPFGSDTRYIIAIALKNKCGITTWQEKFVTVECEPCNQDCGVDIVQFNCNEPNGENSNAEDEAACYACFTIVGSGVVPDCNLWLLSTDVNPDYEIIAYGQTEVVISYADHPGASYYTLNVYQCSQPGCEDSNQVGNGVTETFYDLCGPTANGNIKGSAFSKLSTSEFTFNVQPNPFSEYLELNFLGSNDDQVQINLFDISGKLVLNKRILNTNDSGNSNYNLNTQHLPSGVYFINLKCGEFNQTKKLIKVD